MQIIKPRVSIKPQSQITVVAVSDATIMDDTVVTMDSLTALMGGLAVSQPTMRQTIHNIKPAVTIKTRR